MRWRTLGLPKHEVSRKTLELSLVVTLPPIRSSDSHFDSLPLKNEREELQDPGYG